MGILSDDEHRSQKSEPPTNGSEEDDDYCACPDRAGLRRVEVEGGRLELHSVTIDADSCKGLYEGKRCNNKTCTVSTSKIDGTTTREPKTCGKTRPTGKDYGELNPNEVPCGYTQQFRDAILYDRETVIATQQELDVQDGITRCKSAFTKLTSFDLLSLKDIRCEQWNFCSAGSCTSSRKHLTKPSGPTYSVKYSEIQPGVFQLSCIREYKSDIDFTCSGCQETRLPEIGK